MTVPPFVVALVIAGTLASWCDISARRLPNWLCLGVAVVGLGFAGMTLGMAGLGSHALHAVLALLGGMGLYAIKAIGAGDAKYYAATATWFGLSTGLRLLVSVALCGFLVLAIWALVRRIRGKAVFRQGPGDGDRLPYGVAIAIGAIVAASPL